jgi:hypothetical protein
VAQLPVNSRAVLFDEPTQIAIGAKARRRTLSVEAALTVPRRPLLGPIMPGPVIFVTG